MGHPVTREFTNNGYSGSVTIILSETPMIDY